MKFFHVFSAFALVAAVASSPDVDERAIIPGLSGHHDALYHDGHKKGDKKSVKKKGRKKAIRKGPKGCSAAASPRCCVPQHCQCNDGHVYRFNDANSKAGGSGCDPPMEFLAESTALLPEYCCFPPHLCVGPNGQMNC
ncbi:hypothetical protein XA68_15998 [Ophiocordyceps unilateralis]|uniref:Long chronological lifespan protein 2 n=1 Tax=Ophiocordyceps unilateralis TaxID=268505 RepID=A0A2A9PLW2_OPHUN|nr:hypothetical protein XA68_15998 [Ophiocordyceps unilateralis]